jgi:DNA-directed RNA polymerase specialized sigma24 family protein
VSPTQPSTADEEPSPVKRRSSGPPNDIGSLPTSWLVDFEGGPSAKAVDRLVEDSRLYHVLAAQGFEGPGWERFKDALARYGLQVLLSWLHSGVIFKRCRERGLPTQRQVRLNWEDVRELASITVADAIDSFREKVLRTGSWDPDRGASLKTFFIGQCLLRFPRVYQKWLRDEQAWLLTDEPESHGVVDSSLGPEALAETRLLLAGALAEPSSLKLARVLFLMDTGYGQAEIARRLGTTVGSIESLLYRHRRKEGA